MLLWIRWVCLFGCLVVLLLFSYTRDVCFRLCCGCFNLLAALIVVGLVFTLCCVAVLLVCLMFELFCVCLYVFIYW